MKTRKQPKWFDEYVPEEVSNSSLFKFTIAINKDQKIEVDMRADLDVDYHIAQDQLEDTPSEYAYWAAIYSELKMQCSKLERRIKSKRGLLITEAIKKATEANIKLTDKQTQSLIESDQELNDLELALMVAQKHTGKMYFMIEAIRMKSDNLRTLAGFLKIEMNNTN